MRVFWFILAIILAVVAILTGLAAVRDLFDRDYVEALLNGLICLICIWGLSNALTTLR